MTAAPDQSVHPQLEEQITELVWADRQKIGGFIKNTFPSIVDVLRVAGFRIDGDRSFI
jgi:hypothetical protein